MRKKINPSSRSCLRIDDRVESVSTDSYSPEWSFEGTITSISEGYLNIERDDERLGGGPSGEWRVSINNQVPADIYLLTSEQTPTMSSSSILDFFQNIAATPEEKLLKKFGLENPIGTPTETGLQLAARIQYTKLRAEVIEVAKKMEAEEQAATNKTV